MKCSDDYNPYILDLKGNHYTIFIDGNSGKVTMLYNGPKFSKHSRLVSKTGKSCLSKRSKACAMIVKQIIKLNEIPKVRECVILDFTQVRIHSPIERIEKKLPDSHLY